MKLVTAIQLVAILHGTSAFSVNRNHKGAVTTPSEFALHATTDKPSTSSSSSDQSFPQDDGTLSYFFSSSSSSSNGAKSPVNFKKTKRFKQGLSKDEFKSIEDEVEQDVLFSSSEQNTESTSMGSTSHMFTKPTGTGLRGSDLRLLEHQVQSDVLVNNAERDAIPDAEIVAEGLGEQVAEGTKNVKEISNSKSSLYVSSSTPQNSNASLAVNNGVLGSRQTLLNPSELKLREQKVETSTVSNYEIESEIQTKKDVEFAAEMSVENVAAELVEGKKTFAEVSYKATGTTSHMFVSSMSHTVKPAGATTGDLKELELRVESEVLDDAERKVVGGAEAFAEKMVEQAALDMAKGSTTLLSTSSSSREGTTSELFVSTTIQMPTSTSEIPQTASIQPVQPLVAQLPPVQQSEALIGNKSMEVNGATPFSQLSVDQMTNLEQQAETTVVTSAETRVIQQTEPTVEKSVEEGNFLKYISSFIRDSFVTTKAQSKSTLTKPADTEKDINIKSTTKQSDSGNGSDVKTWELKVENDFATLVENSSALKVESDIETSVEQSVESLSVLDLASASKQSVSDFKTMEMKVENNIVGLVENPSALKVESGIETSVEQTVAKAFESSQYNSMGSTIEIEDSKPTVTLDEPLITKLAPEPSLSQATSASISAPAAKPKLTAEGLRELELQVEQSVIGAAELNAVKEVESNTEKFVEQEIVSHYINHVEPTDTDNSPKSTSTTTVGAQPYIDAITKIASEPKLERKPQLSAEELRALEMKAEQSVEAKVEKQVEWAAEKSVEKSVEEQATIFTQENSPFGPFTELIRGTSKFFAKSKTTHFKPTVSNVSSQKENISSEDKSEHNVNGISNRNNPILLAKSVLADTSSSNVAPIATIVPESAKPQVPATPKRELTTEAARALELKAVQSVVSTTESKSEQQVEISVEKSVVEDVGKVHSTFVGSTSKFFDKPSVTEHEPAATFAVPEPAKSQTIVVPAPATTQAAATPKRKLTAEELRALELKAEQTVIGLTESKAERQVESNVEKSVEQDVGKVYTTFVGSTSNYFVDKPSVTAEDPAATITVPEPMKPRVTASPKRELTAEELRRLELKAEQSVFGITESKAQHQVQITVEKSVEEDVANINPAFGRSTISKPFIAKDEPAATSVVKTRPIEQTSNLEQELTIEEVRASELKTEQSVVKKTEPKAEQKVESTLEKSVEQDVATFGALGPVATSLAANPIQKTTDLKRELTIDELKALKPKEEGNVKREPTVDELRTSKLQTEADVTENPESRVVQNVELNAEKLVIDHVEDGNYLDSLSTSKTISTSGSGQGGYLDNLSAQTAKASSGQDIGSYIDNVNQVSVDSALTNDTPVPARSLKVSAVMVSTSSLSTKDSKVEDSLRKMPASVTGKNQSRNNGIQQLFRVQDSYVEGVMTNSDYLLNVSSKMISSESKILETSKDQNIRSANEKESRKNDVDGVATGSNYRLTVSSKQIKTESKILEISRGQTIIGTSTSDGIKFNSKLKSAPEGLDSVSTGNPHHVLSREELSEKIVKAHGNHVDGVSMTSSLRFHNMSSKMVSSQSKVLPSKSKSSTTRYNTKLYANPSANYNLEPDSDMGEEGRIGSDLRSIELKAEEAVMQVFQGTNSKWDAPTEFNAEAVTSKLVSSRYESKLYMTPPDSSVPEPMVNEMRESEMKVEEEVIDDVETKAELSVQNSSQEVKETIEETKWKVAAATSNDTNGSEIKSRTQRIMESTQPEGQASGAGGASTWNAFLRTEENWRRLRDFEPFKYDNKLKRSIQNGIPPPPSFVTDDGAKGNPEAWKKLRDQLASADEKSKQGENYLDFDVVICGGTLGIFIATALQLKGHSVCVVEGGKLQGREQEWNISMDEMLELVEMGVLTQQDLDQAIKTEFPACRSGFKNKEASTTGSYSENGIGYECLTADVLNLGVAPAVLIQNVKQRFLDFGGTVKELTPIKGVMISEDIGACVDLGDSETPITARLILDCMGNGSPISRQQRYGLKPDGVCCVVGSCASGFDKETNVIGDIIYTNSEIQDKGEQGMQQYFWEAFPVGIGRNGQEPGTSDVKTTYMFTYIDASKERPDLMTLMDDYWDLLPLYQPSITDLEKDLDVKRVLFAFFPTYQDSPLEPAWSRMLAVGDASGIQSPLSFGGFGALTRHLDRVTGAVSEALKYGCLHKDDLSMINAYTPNLSATWMFQKAMSVRVGQKVDPKFVNRLLATNFDCMDEMGIDTIKPFLQDVVRIDGLLGSLAKSFVADPTYMPTIVKHVGIPTLVEWLGHVSMMGAYTAYHAAVTPLINPFVKNMRNPRKRFQWRRRMEAWKFGSGGDYILPRDELKKE